MPPTSAAPTALYRLPRLATAPFCPSEVRGSVSISPGAPFWQHLARMAGPGLLVAVGYMDPGSWATDIAAGSQFGYALLWVVLLASLTAMLLQTLSLRLGLVAQQDLARYSPRVNRALWLMAELAIVACDEVAGMQPAAAVRNLNVAWRRSPVAGIHQSTFRTSS